MTITTAAIQILAGWGVGLVTAWLATSAHAARELRRKHEEWREATIEMQTEMAAMALELAGKPVVRDPMCPRGMVYLMHGKGGKTGGDAA